MVVLLWPCQNHLRSVRSAAKDFKDLDGRGSRIRTCDLLVPNQTRYQTALCPAGHRRSIHASPRCGKQASAGVKDRRSNAVTGRNAKFLRSPADNFKNSADGSVRRDKPGRQRLGVLGYAQNATVTADKNHVERNIGVLHPEADFLLPMEVEQHSLPFR